MQVSVETTSTLERRVKVAVPATRLESAINARLQQAARTAKVDGFRPGKVPLSVVQKRYGAGIRQEALSDLVRDAFYEAVEAEKLNPAGMPTIESISDESGKDLEFVAVVEVFPEITLASFAGLEVERPTADVTDADLDAMIENLRKQRGRWVDSSEAAKDGDRVEIDFAGTVDGEAFEGGSATNFALVLGSKRMIPGFEDQLIGAKAGEERVLQVTFPEDYQAESLRGKAAEFKVTVNKVATTELPAIDEEFFKAFGVVEGGMDRFRAEVRKNMDRELRQAIKGRVKNQVMDALVKAHEGLEVPKALIGNEIGRLKQQMLRQFGGGQQINLPDELFADQAKRQVALGLIVGEIIKTQEMKADPVRVHALIEEVAESYEKPQEVLSWYLSNKEQLAQVESVVLEDQVVDKVLADAKITDKTVSYEELLRQQRG